MAFSMMITNLLVCTAAIFSLAAVYVDADYSLPWYQQGIVYQVYPRSFQDSDGDGIGDLKGFLQRVDYLASLGIDAVWFSPLYPSPNKDFGYDISNYTAISPEYGTMEDFENVVKALAAKGIRVVMDYVPNHTSDQHVWFNMSANKVSGYEDFYVWLEPNYDYKGAMQPPNNWVAAFGGSMWKYNEARKKMYLHQYAEGQPDLNYRCPALVEEMKNVLKFWLQKGVAGFRMDTVATLVENNSWLDEPYIGGDPTQYGSYNHTMTSEQSLTYVILREFKQVLEEYSVTTQTEPKIMMTESYANDPKILRRYYGTEGAPATTFPFNFLAILDTSVTSTAEDWANVINTWYYNGYDDNTVMPGYWAQPNFVLGNHDQHRFASRYAPEYTDILNMLQLTLKGTAVVFNGDELGMVDSDVRRDEGKDIQGLNAGPGQFHSRSRDPERAPMQWSNEQNAGFSTGQPWLPLTSDYVLNNVQSQEAAAESHLKVFRAAAQLRKTKTLIYGESYVTSYENALIVIRSLMDNPTIITVINLSDVDQRLNLQLFRPNIPATVNVLVKSINFMNYNAELNSTDILLPPVSGVILSS